MTDSQSVDRFELKRWKSIKSASKSWYKNVQVLGIGGNSVTFLALCTTPPRRGELVAIKVFRRRSKPERREAFLREIEFLEQCDHPSVLRILDKGEYVFGTGTDERAPFVVTEYLPQTLRKAMRGGRLTAVTKVSYALQLVSALAYLQTLKTPVIHRDVKPENIFIKGGSCVLGDFGLMKLISTQDGDDKDLVKSSIGVGMPYRYRTPDLVAYLRGEAAISTKTDVFQLGLVLAEVFTGRNPHQAAQEFDSQVVLAPLGPVRCKCGNRISNQIGRMLDMSANTRPDAQQLIDHWQGIFMSVVDAAVQLEGHAF